MSVCLPICLCIYVSVCPSVSQSVCQCVCLSVCLPVSLSACQSLSLSASQPASQSIFTRNASYAQTSSEVSAKRQRPSLACKHKFQTKFHKNDGKHQGLHFHSNDRKCPEASETKSMSAVPNGARGVSNPGSIFWQILQISAIL